MRLLRRQRILSRIWKVESEKSPRSKRQQIMVQRSNLNVVMK